MKKIIVLLCIAMMLIIACVPQNSPTQETQQPATEGAQTSANPRQSQTAVKPAPLIQNANEFNGVLRDALKLNVPLRCGWEDNDGNKIVYYVNGKKTRMETTDKQNDTTYLVVADNCTFAWGLGEKTGMEMCATPEDATQQETADDITPSQEFTVHCVKTTIADTMFVKPATVKFVDLEDIVGE